MSTSCSKTRPPAGERAVTEVLGQIITFGIISMIVFGAILAFGPIQARAETRVARVEAEGAATQVAAAVSQLATLAQLGAESASIDVRLPEDIAGRPYSVTIDIDRAGVDTVRVEVDGVSVIATAPLFGLRHVDLDAATGGTQAACSLTVSGSALRAVLGPPPDAAALTLRFDDDPDNGDSIVPSTCTQGPPPPPITIYLEDTL